MIEEQVMVPIDRHNLLSTQLNEPHGSNVALPLIQSVSAIRQTNSSKRRRQRSRRKRLEPAPVNNMTKLDVYLNKAGCVFTTYMKGRLQQHNTSGDDAVYELDRFINVVKSREPGGTCIDAFWELLEFAEGPHHCSRLLADKFEQRFVPLQEQCCNDQPPEGTKKPASNEADSVPVDETSMNLLAVNRCLHNQSLINNSAAGSSFDVHFQTANFENQWEQQPDAEAHFY